MVSFNEHTPMQPHIQGAFKSKQKIERNKESVRPTVINDQLIGEYMVQYNRENKIFDDDDRQIWDLTHLALSFKNIVEIDNLIGLNKLTKLQLDNNIITKIQGLETLTELRWLDLSFNMIEKIEGLENLRQLEDLSLFSNRIVVLEGLDTLENLNVLSIGSNLLASLDDSVKYLHLLRNNLEVLKINNNSFRETGEKEYKRRIIAYIQRLKYLDYQLIEEKEKERAFDDFKTELESASHDNEEQKDNTEAKMAYKQLEEAHIHHTQNLFVSCCEAFEDYDKISKFLKYNEVWSFSEGTIDEFITSFQNAVKSKHKEKKKILGFCNQKMIKAERDAEVDSISKIEGYKKQQKHLFRVIDAARAQEDPSRRITDYSTYEEQLQGFISTLKGDLLDIEMALQQALEQARNSFFGTVKLINEEISNLQLELNGNINNEVQVFGQKLKEELNREREAFIVKLENDPQQALEEYGYTEIETGTVLDILTSNDSNEGVDELVTQFIEKIEQEASAKDTAISKGVANEWKSIQSNIQDSQQTRSRNIISEIIKTTKHFYDAIGLKFNNYRDEDEEEN